MFVLADRAGGQQRLADGKLLAKKRAVEPENSADAGFVGDDRLENRRAAIGLIIDRFDKADNRYIFVSFDLIDFYRRRQKLPVARIVFQEIGDRLQRQARQKLLPSPARRP